MIGHTTRRFLLILSLLMVSGCTEGPRERLEAAWAAADEEAFDRYVSYFTADSVPLIRGLAETTSRTKKAYRYIDSPYELTPMGDILSVEERDQLTLITVKAKESYTLRMLLQSGNWMIDGTSLGTLWAPLKEGESEG
tara:strand:- start:154 stop:567 length:414 start_codon:yes stop_codon:yes gene_type:complete